MLNKTVCKQCIMQLSEYSIKHMFGMPMNKEMLEVLFEYYWKGGLTLCRTNKTTKFAIDPYMRFMEVEKQPPEDCLFILEHTVSA